MIIFINGMHFNGILKRKKGGTKNYWSMGDGGNFAQSVMDHLGDHNPKYIDGSQGGIINTILSIIARDVRDCNLNPFMRRRRGRKIANSIFKEVRAAINNKETIKIITHSMGAEFAKGLLEQLVIQCSKYGIAAKDVIEFEADFAPFLPEIQSAVEGIPTYQFSHSEDIWAWNHKINGAIKVDTSEDICQGHGVGTFFNQIKKL